MGHSQPDSEGPERAPAGIRAPYPAPPLSWLAPALFYTCGFMASSAMTSTRWPRAFDPARQASGLGAAAGNSAPLFLLGLLLAGPLLGVAWRASAHIRLCTELVGDPPAGAFRQPRNAIPYTLPGSASDRLGSWLAAISTRLRNAQPKAGQLLLQLLASSVFSLAVAAVLGQRTLAVTMAALLCLCASSVFGDRSAQCVRSERQEAVRLLLDTSLPILFAWLIGHVTYAAISANSVLIAACYAVAVYGAWQIERTGKGLLTLLLPQTVAVAYLLVARQPVMAAVVILLMSAQLLWSSQLPRPASRSKYLRAVQIPLAATMLLTAWALGYGP